MKNLIYGMLALSIMGIALACQKDSTSTASSTELMAAIANSTNKESVMVSSLPTSIREYVALSFSPMDIETAWHAKNLGYQVELEDGQNLYFRENGGCMGTGDRSVIFRCMHGDTVDVSELPQAALDYITANYAGIDIETVVQKTRGDRTGYAVELVDGTILLFRGQGAFVTLCGDFDGDGDGHGDGPGHGGHGHGDGPHGGGGPDGGPHGGCAAGDTIETEDLPALAQQFINDTYSGVDITVVVVKPSGKYGVELANGIVLLFNADGTFIKECDGQPDGGPHHHHCNAPVTDLSDLPQPAQDYITDTYPGETIARGCVKNNGNYIVKLSGGAKILFDADGNVLFDSGN